MPGGGRVPAAIGVDTDRDVRSGCLPDDFHALQIAGRIEADFHFQALHAPLQEALGQLDGPPHLERADDHLDRDRRPHFAAEQLVNRHARRLAGQVPEPHLDARFRERIELDLLVHPATQHRDLGWIGDFDSQVGGQGRDGHGRDAHGDKVVFLQCRRDRHIQIGKGRDAAYKGGRRDQLVDRRRTAKSRFGFELAVIVGVVNEFELRDIGISQRAPEGLFRDADLRNHRAGRIGHRQEVKGEPQHRDGQEGIGQTSVSLHNLRFPLPWRSRQGHLLGCIRRVCRRHG